MQKVKASQQQSAGKIARKRMTGATSARGGSGGVGGHPAGSNSSGGTGAAYNRKANKLPDFGRKRLPKPKMRGVFGAPGVGLQRPADGTGRGGSGTAVTGNVSSTGRMVAELKGSPAWRTN
jgi:hypothetical protein